MEIDSYVELGTNHMICEDYIRHGESPVPYVILSDGCSSSKDTDIGARILVNQTYRLLKFGFFDICAIKTPVIWRSSSIIDLLFLSNSCLDATLLIAIYLNNSIQISMFGDGNIILVDQKDNIKIINISYKENAPYYLSYLLGGRKTKEYLGKFSPVYTITNYKGLKENNKDTSICIEEYPFRIFNPENYKAIFIASDGLESFNIPLPEVVKELMDFKTTKGEFLKRRMKKAITKLGSHYDDISIGGFIF